MDNLIPSQSSLQKLKYVEPFEYLADLALSSLTSASPVTRRTEIPPKNEIGSKFHNPHLQTRETNCLSITLRHKTVPLFIITISRELCGGSLLEIGRALISLSAHLPENFVFDFENPSFRKPSDENASLLRRTWIFADTFVSSCYVDGNFAHETSWIQELQGTIEASCQSQHSIECPLFVEMLGEISTALPLEQYLHLAPQFCIFSPALFSGRGSFQKVTNDEWSLQMTIDEPDIQKSETQKIERLPISLDIGNIELTLADLLRLRAGMQIEFALPPTIQASLRIGQSPLVKGKLNLSSDTAVFEVTECLWSS